MKYKLYGTYRKITSTGIMQPFRRIVTADNPRAAMNKNTERLYKAGYDHILHLSVYVREDNKWKHIEMMEALGLE